VQYRPFMSSIAKHRFCLSCTFYQKV